MRKGYLLLDVDSVRDCVDWRLQDESHMSLILLTQMLQRDK